MPSLLRSPVRSVKVFIFPDAATSSKVALQLMDRFNDVQFNAVPYHSIQASISFVKTGSLDYDCKISDEITKLGGLPLSEVIN